MAFVAGPAAVHDDQRTSTITDYENFIRLAHFNAIIGNQVAAPIELPANNRT